MLGATLPPTPTHAHAHARNRNWDLEQEHDYDYDDEHEVAHFALEITAQWRRSPERLIAIKARNFTQVLLDFSMHHDSVRLFFHDFKPEPFVQT
jgi:hypothetical protein